MKLLVVEGIDFWDDYIQFSYFHIDYLKITFIFYNSYANK